MDDHPQRKTVAVIGAGWCGLYALKTFLEDGHQAEAFERSDGLGGQWRYSEDRPGGVFRSTIPTSSKCYLHASDFPLDHAASYYPHHTQLLDYLRRYALHFALDRHIHFGHTVLKVRKKPDKHRSWVVT